MNNEEKPASLWDKLKVFPQHLLPQHFLTSIVYSITRIETAFIKNNLIRFFMWSFDIDMKDYIKQTPEEFKHFNEFFTRELKPDARPIADSLITSPVDGFISQFGKIEKDQLIQAKGHNYSLSALLANDKQTNQYENGEYTTIYLSPRNYHRIHIPIDGKLTKMTYVPGDLYAVNEHTTRVVDNLFARNERIILYFQTELGPMALIMVGAIFVGSMETPWQGEITPAENRTIRHWNYEDINFKKGDEVGRFNMGSTVILLFPKDALAWQERLEQSQAVFMGQSLAKNKE